MRRRFMLLLVPALAIMPTVGFASAAHAGTYQPRVTMKDIKDGGGSCSFGGGLCIINHSHWDCSGKGYCTKVNV